MVNGTAATEPTAIRAKAANQNVVLAHISGRVFVRIGKRVFVIVEKRLSVGKSKFDATTNGCWGRPLRVVVRMHCSAEHDRAYQNGFIDLSPTDMTLLPPPPPPPPSPLLLARLWWIRPLQPTFVIIIVVVVFVVIYTINIIMITCTIICSRNFVNRKCWPRGTWQWRGDRDGMINTLSRFDKESTPKGVFTHRNGCKLFNFNPGDVKKDTRRWSL